MSEGFVNECTGSMSGCTSLNGFDAKDYKNAVIRDNAGRFMKSVPHDEDGSIVLGIVGGDELSWEWITDPTPSYQHHCLSNQERESIEACIKKLDANWADHPSLTKYRLTPENVNSVMTKNRRIEALRSDGVFDVISRQSDHIGVSDDISTDAYQGFHRQEDVMIGPKGERWFVVSPTFIMVLESVVPANATAQLPETQLFSIDDDDVVESPDLLYSEKIDSPLTPWDTLNAAPESPVIPTSVDTLPDIPLILGVYERRSHDLLVDVEYKAPDNLIAMVRSQVTKMSDNTFDSIINLGFGRGCFSANFFGANNYRESNIRIPLPIPDTNVLLLDAEDASVFKYKPTDLLVVNVRLFCVTANGVPNAVSNGGYGLVSLHELLKENYVTIPIKYDQYDQIVGVVSLRNPRVVFATRDARARVIHPQSSAVEHMEQEGKTIDAYFEEMVMRIAHLRLKTLPYSDLPNLTKFWVTLPQGMTMLSTISTTHSAMSADQLEELIACMFRHAVNDKEIEIQTMVKEEMRPSLEFSEKYAAICARVLHLIIRRMNYYADRVLFQDMYGNMRQEAVDNFDHSPSADPLNGSEDCDGSSNEAIRVIRQIGLAPYGRYNEQGDFLSDDVGYDEKKHVMTSVLRDGLFHHMAFTAIVAAYSAQGTDIVAGNTSLAGHMAPFLVPIWNAHSALVRGTNVRRILRKSKHDGLDSDEKLVAGLPEKNLLDLTGDVIDKAYAGALMPASRLMALPLEDRPRKLSPSAWMKSFADRRNHVKGIHALLLDGTVTNDEVLHIENSAEREAHLDAAERMNRLKETIGGTIGMDFEISLVCKDGTGSKNKFVHELVEVTACVDTPELRALGLACRAYCTTAFNPSNATVALKSGTTVQQLYDGMYAWVPMEFMDVQRGSIYDQLVARVLDQTMPARQRSPKGQLYHEDDFNVNNSKKSVQSLMDLNNANLEDAGMTTVNDPLTVHVYARTLWNSPQSVAHACERFKSLHRPIRIIHTPLEQFGKGAAHVSVRIY
jgi:hypothetical protein